MTIFFLISCILFFTGLALVLAKKTRILMLAGVELMLQAGNILLIYFNQIHHTNLDGQIFAAFVMVLSAAEITVGLALLVKIKKEEVKQII